MSWFATAKSHRRQNVERRSCGRNHMARTSSTLSLLGGRWRNVTCERVNKITIITFPHHLLEISRGGSTDHGTRGQWQPGNNLLLLTKWPFKCRTFPLCIHVPVCVSLVTNENLKTSKKDFFVLLTHYCIAVNALQQAETLLAWFTKNEHLVPSASPWDSVIPRQHSAAQTIFSCTSYTFSYDKYLSFPYNIFSTTVLTCLYPCPFSSFADSMRTMWHTKTIPNPLKKILYKEI